MLKDLQYNFFTANEITPKGWLREQLLLQAKGLSGNLDKVWPTCATAPGSAATARAGSACPTGLTGSFRSPTSFVMRT